MSVMMMSVMTAYDYHVDDYPPQYYLDNIPDGHPVLEAQELCAKHLQIPAALSPTQIICRRSTLQALTCLFA